ncbi:MAG: PadR family transcriptional regulator [Propionibacteriaceae bacterium]|nr:PadR family transcriptional regulator [Propionibacteriaceae bacterium]
MEENSHDPQLLKGVLRMLVLQVLRDEETYGYELVTRLTDRGLAGISTGTVYPVLNRLEKEGLLGSRLVASTAGPARKYYGVTDKGKGALSDAISGWEHLASAVGAVLGSAGTHAPTDAGTSPAASATTTKGKIS